MINRIPNETKRFRISYIGEFLGDFIKTYGINLIKRGLCEIGERVELHSSVDIPSGFVRARIRTGVTGPTGPTGLSQVWGLNEGGLISSYNQELFQVGPTGINSPDGDILSVGDETGETIETLPITISGTDIGNIIVSGTGTTSQGAQSFFAPGPLKSIDVNVKKVGTPTDNLTVAIQGDNNGQPDGVDIATKTIAPADLTTALQEIELTNFNITLSVATYWLVFRRTDSSSTNFYVLSLIIGGDSDPYENGKFLTYDGVWFEVSEESSNSLTLPTANNAVAGATGWSNPDGAQEDTVDSYYAYATPPDGVIYSHVWHTLGFTIPVKSVIAGIIVQARGSTTSGASGERFNVTLTKNANDKVGETKNNFVTTSVATTNNGSKSDLWDTTFTPQEINSNNFGVRLDSLAGFSGISWRCIFLKVRVYYYEEGVEKYMDAKINVSSEFPEAPERIYITTSDDVMFLDSDDGDWYSLWQGILQKDALNEDYPSILKNLGSGGTLILANENKIHTLIATANSSTEAEENRLTFDPVYYINWLGVTSSAVFIGLRNKYGSTYPSQIAYYEPYSDRVRIFSIKEGETIGFIKDENCHIIDKKGQMRVFSGQSFQPYDYFPPYHRDEDMTSLPHRNGILVKGDIVKIAWEGQYPDPAGIWVYQDNNLYHKNGLSISTEIGAIELNEMKALYEEDVIYSGANLDDGSQEIEGVYVTGSKNSSANIVTSKMISPEITHTWQDIVLKYRNGEFIVKQKIEPDGLTEGSGATAFAGTWTATGFTASIEAYDTDGSIKVGDEVIVRKGAGAGLITHITEIDGTAVTVDKTTPTTGSFTFSVERWSKVNIDHKDDKLSAKGSLKDQKLENAQFKIELGGTLEEIQVQSEVDKTIKK